VSKAVRAVHVVLVVALGAAAAWVLSQGRREREDPAEVLRALRASRGPVLPPAGRAGALSRGEVRRYDRDRLHELVNGAAEAYLARGFESCAAAVYAFAGEAAPREVAAEAHRFRSEEGARTQLEAERPRAAREVPGLPRAASDGQVLLALAGRDLLKLTSLDPGPWAGEQLAAVAAAWRKENEP
jgi:hypothetical protein